MAGTEVGSLYYDLNIDDKNLNRQLDNADKKVKGFGDRINQYWGASQAASKKFMLGVAAAGAAVIGFGVSSVKAFQDSQDKIAQTNAVLKSTHGIAGMSADAVTKLATALEAQTKFSDEDVRSVENLLLTFTSLNKKIFPQATKTVLDMATALGEDTKSASIQLGKALQDPILGVTALRRVGVNFNSAQQEVIANLVNTGHTAKAQALIMKELTKEFGGSAEAAGGTLSGAMAKLKNQLNNVQESIGGLIAAGLNPLLQKLLDWFYRVGGVNGVMQILKDTLDKIKPNLPIIAGAIAGILTPAIVGMTLAFGEFLLTIAPWAALGVAIVLIFQHFSISISDTRNALTATGNYLAAFFIPILSILKQVWDAMYPSIIAVWHSLQDNLLPSLKQAWDAVVRLWNALNPGLMTALKVIGIFVGAVIVGALYVFINALNITIRVVGVLTSGVSNLIKFISNLIGWVGTASVSIVRWFGGLPNAIGKALSGVSNAIIAPFKSAFSWIQQQIDHLVGAISNIKKAAGNVLSAPGKAASGILHSIPGFATGGTVPGPIGAPMLAVVHGGEEVIPNGKTGGGPTFNIGQINNAQDESWVIRRIDRDQKLESMGLSPARV